mgnify:FL=1
MTTQLKTLLQMDQEADALFKKLDDLRRRGLGSGEPNSEYMRCLRALKSVTAKRVEHLRHGNLIPPSI